MFLFSKSVQLARISFSRTAPRRDQFIQMMFWYACEDAIHPINLRQYIQELRSATRVIMKINNPKNVSFFKNFINQK